jgi:hypothetical protein
VWAAEHFLPVIAWDGERRDIAAGS